MALQLWGEIFGARWNDWSVEPPTVEDVPAVRLRCLSCGQFITSSLRHMALCPKSYFQLSGFVIAALRAGRLRREGTP